MFKQRLHRQLFPLLPAYLNGGLSPLQKWVLARWVSRDPAARAELARLQGLREALRAQPVQLPDPRTFARVQARLARESAPAPAPAPLFPGWAWAGGVLVTALIFLLIWFSLPPGILLQWSVQGEPPRAFRVYRAPLGSEAYELVGEFSYHADTPHYRFFDPLLLPGQRYVYRIEGISPQGEALVSQSIVADALDALPGQVILLAAVVFFVYSLWRVVETLGDSKGSMDSPVSGLV